jgi:hypothetical protein
MSISVNTRPAAARAFVRSLNILLKFARMYDFGHPRTAKQYEIAWNELKAALGADNEAGLLLAVSGEQLLLDGTPLDSAAAEKGFARMLSSAGIASIHFSPKVTQASLARLVKGFPTNTTSKTAQLTDQLKAALQGDPHIHVNEVCFVPADSAVAKSTVAAQLAARTIGMNTEQQDALFSSPEKLLQLIVAAEGGKGGNGGGSGIGGGNGSGGGSGNGSGSGSGGRSGSGTGTGTGTGAGTDGGGSIFGGGGGSETGIAAAAETVISAEGGAEAGEHPSRWANATTGIRSGRSARGAARSMAVETGLMTLHEDELQGILQVLAQIARTGEVKDRLDPSSFQGRLSTLPRRARFTVSQALSALAAQAPTEASDKPTLLKLAEHIAVRFAVESYERGDTKVNTVRQMLDEMSTELDGLRKILGVYEQKMAGAGIDVPSHVDVLAQQFWAHIPEEKQREALDSDDAWCVPPVKARECIEKMLLNGEREAADKILRKYVSGISKESREIRRHTSMGIVELAPLYAASEERLFVDTIRQIGVQLAEETDSELQSLVGAAFVRLAQEATSKRAFRAIQRSVEVADYIEAERPGVGKNLRPRIAIESRLPEFIDEALRAGEVSGGLRDLLRRIPNPAAESIAKRFGRVSFREDCELLVSMMETLGSDGLEHLKHQLIQGNPHEATEAIGILARVDIETVQRVLQDRMKDWKRTAHDRVIRQIAASGSPHRARLMLELFDRFDPLIRPLVIDEIGMCGDQSSDRLLLRIADGDLPKDATDYLRLKAIEALGRLRVTGAETVLRNIAEARKTWRWSYPSELRLVAAQAMEKLDPDWVRNFVPRSGLNPAEFAIEILDIDPNSSAIRQRRYPRLRLEHPMWATTTNLRENCRIEIPEMTLGGGVAVCEQSLYPGSVVELKLNPAQKSVKAQTIVRDANTQARAFEVVDIDLEERAKLRKLLVQLGNAQKESTPQERSRGPRTILPSSS